MNLAFVGEPADESYLPHLKPLLAGHRTSVILRKIDTTAELYSKFDGIITTREDLLQRLTFQNGRISISNYSGSLFIKGTKPFLILDPLRNIVVTPTGLFIARRYLEKITKPDKWFPQSPFTWELADEITIASLYSRFSSANFIAIDIETTRGDPHCIRCSGYCAVWFNSDGSFSTHTVVLPYTSMFWVEWVRKFNDLPNIKAFQNGHFDNLYFNRFGSPVNNWLLDTMEMFHSWYSELPKSLDYITLFLLRNVWYWKDDGDTGNLHDFYEYNARDCWSTANCILAILSECPDWAFQNFKIKLPTVLPAFACSCEGLRYDLTKVDKTNPDSLRNKEYKKVEDSLKSLRAKINQPTFNPGSWQQTLSLVHVIDGKDNFKDTNEKTMAKFARKHPLNNLIVEEIKKYREAKKLVSTYFDTKLWGDRLLYQIVTSGTDTNRFASRASAFSGYGTQIQNFSDAAKEAVIADEGFYLGEADNKNSEGYCMAYLSGDKNLLETVNSGKDYHSVNIERFFGAKYDEVWDSIKMKTLNKALRDLSKRVNHGTAYVMGAYILLETMGMENVIKAQKLLNLPIDWSALQVCDFLLSRYHLAYPGVSKDYYPWVKAIVKLGKMLTSPLGWTRYCFGDPSRGGHEFKALVAHCPQNFSVGILNRGFVKIFHEIQVPNWKDFRLKAQIHDSAFFQYRIGRIDLALKARKIMEQDIKVKDVKGVERIMRIPVELKGEANRWSELKAIAA